MRHHRGQRRGRHLDRQVHRAPVPFIDDEAVAARVVVADQESRDLFDRFLRGREADALQTRASLAGPSVSAADSLQPFERQRQMRAATRANHRVNLIHDHGADAAQHLPAAFGGQQQIERLGRRHQNVRRRFQHRRPLGRGRVAGSHCRGEARHLDASLLTEPADASARLGQVLVDVGAQRLERRDVDHAHFVGQRRRAAFVDQLVDRRQERGERLAGAGGRGDQCVAARANGVPSSALRRGGLTNRFEEPA